MQARHHYLIPVDLNIKGIHLEDLASMIASLQLYKAVDNEIV
jgi:hypothetical protein